MSKYGLSLIKLKQKKTATFLDKMWPWMKSIPREKRHYAYHLLVLYASEHIPLVHQDEVIEKAQAQYSLSK